VSLILTLAASGLLLLSPIERVEPEHACEVDGAYTGTSVFTADNPENAGYSEVLDIWFEFTEPTYRYGVGEDFPQPGATDVYSWGLGPFTFTDTTISLDGGYVKVLRPAVVLRGLFEWEFQGDTLVLTQVQTDPPTGLHMLRLLRR